MRPPEHEVIVIDSSSDDDEPAPKRARAAAEDSDSDGDVVILDEAPHAQDPAPEANALGGDGDDDLMMTGATGVVATRDLPHARCHCGVHVFDPSPRAKSHAAACDNCFCYVCDVPASECDQWGRGNNALDHCHATPSSSTWQGRRLLARQRTAAAAAADAGASGAGPIAASAPRHATGGGGSGQHHWPLSAPQPSSPVYSAYHQSDYEKELANPATDASLVHLGTLVFDVELDKSSYARRQGAPASISSLATKLAPYGFRYGLGIPHRLRGQRPRRKNGKLDLDALCHKLEIKSIRGQPGCDVPTLPVASSKEMMVVLLDAKGRNHVLPVSVDVSWTHRRMLETCAGACRAHMPPSMSVGMLFPSATLDTTTHTFGREVCCSSSQWTSRLDTKVENAIDNYLWVRAFVLPEANVTPNHTIIDAITVNVLRRDRHAGTRSDIGRLLCKMPEKEREKMCEGTGGGDTNDSCLGYLFEDLASVVVPRPKKGTSVEAAAKLIKASAVALLGGDSSAPHCRLYQNYTNYSTEPSRLFSKETVQGGSHYYNYGWPYVDDYHDDYHDDHPRRKTVTDWRTRKFANLVFEVWSTGKTVKPAPLPPASMPRKMKSLSVKEATRNASCIDRIVSAHRARQAEKQRRMQTATMARHVYSNLVKASSLSSRIEEDYPSLVNKTPAFRTAFSLSALEAASGIAEKEPGELTIKVYVAAPGKADQVRPAMSEVFVVPNQSNTWARARLPGRRASEPDIHSERIDPVVRAVMYAGRDGAELRKQCRLIGRIKTPEELEAAEKETKGRASSQADGASGSGAGAGGGQDIPRAGEDDGDDTPCDDDYSHVPTYDNYGVYYDPYRSRVSLKDFLDMSVAEERPQTTQPAGLNVTMHNYQLQTLRWMLDQEKVVDGLRSILWTKVRLEGGRTAFYSHSLGVIAERVPSCPRGGFLAEAMGMGKTIISLALILAHPAPPLAEAPVTATTKPTPDDPIGSRATLVVCAVSLVGQWIDEARSKLAADNPLRVYMYHGQNRLRDVKRVADDFDLVVTTYATLGADFSKANREAVKRPPYDAKHHPLGSIKWHRVILDESHSIKQPNVNQTKACIALRGNLRWCASGTPVNNGIEDLFGQMCFLRAAPLDSKNGFDLGLKHHFFNGFVSASKARELAAVLKRCMVRHTQSQVMQGKKLLTLPEKDDVDVAVTLSAGERQKYDELQKEAQRAYGAIKQQGPSAIQRNRFTVLSLLQPLRRFCSGGSLAQKDLKAPPQHTGGRRHTNQQQQQSKDKKPVIAPGAGMRSGGASGSGGGAHARTGGAGGSRGPNADVKPVLAANESQVCSDLLDLPPASADATGADVAGADDAEPDVPAFVSEAKLSALVKELERMRARDVSSKALVFTQFHGTLLFLQRKLVEAGFGYRSITGSMPLKQRDRAIQAFQKDPPTTIFLLSMRSGAVGINLTSADHVFLVEPCMNPALEAQAVGRAWRMGQQRKVHVKRLYVKDSIEQRVRELAKKREKSGPQEPDPSGRGKGKAKKAGADCSDLAGSLKADKAALKESEFDVLFGIDA